MLKDRMTKCFIALFISMVIGGGTLFYAKDSIVLTILGLVLIFGGILYIHIMLGKRADEYLHEIEMREAEAQKIVDETLNDTYQKITLESALNIVVDANGEDENVISKLFTRALQTESLTLWVKKDLKNGKLMYAIKDTKGFPIASAHDEHFVYFAKNVKLEDSDEE